VLLAVLQTSGAVQCWLPMHSTHRMVAVLHALLVGLAAQSASEVQLMTHMALPAPGFWQTCPAGQCESMVQTRQTLVVLQCGLAVVQVVSSMHCTQLPVVVLQARRLLAVQFALLRHCTQRPGGN
jgi:hypothetical protein